MSKDAILERIGVSGYNKPKRTPNHPTFKARHAKNIAKGKLSAAWWSSVTKW